jgi:uncharacterized protein
MANTFRSWLIPSLAALLAVPMLARADAESSPPIAWQTRWNATLFTEAAREHRFVLLDLHAVWCHWCHVMDEETYRDPAVRALIARQYLPVSVDADGDPGLASRYGEWGWPATIVLAADGTEIVKRRGYIPPQEMASLLNAIIDDPSPGPSVYPATAGARVMAGQLSAAQRADLLATNDTRYDEVNGGWGTVHKFLDAPIMELTLAQAGHGDAIADRRARQTLDANLQLIDPVWGGVYQYSDAVDWTSPHFEKLLAFQADDLRLYADGYARWHDPRYLRAAQVIREYVAEFLTSPDGAFYVSQDADLSPQVAGREYYSRGDAERRRLGIPGIDRHEYARENGWFIRALCSFYDVTGDTAALTAAERAADWVLANRALTGGGFHHSEESAAGPFLDDTTAMGEAFVALYRSTGDRRWLANADAALHFIAAYHEHPAAGFVAAPVPEHAHGVFREPVRALEQNAAVVRLANMVFRYAGNQYFRQLALHGMKYLATVPADSGQVHAELLLADGELATAPTHIAVVGGKNDPAARALHAAALRYPAEYLQVDWWDRAEGPLPNPEVRYPRLAVAAAFICTANTCSNPVYDAEKVVAGARSSL